MVVDIQCGCLYEHDDSGSLPPTAIAQCAEHEAQSRAFDEQLARNLGYELDIYVAAHAKGRHAQLIRGPDDTRR